MKSLTLNVDSWHYKLASNFGYDPDFKEHDVCAYTRRVLLGMIVTTFFTIAGVAFTWGVSILLVNMVLSPWFYFMYGLPIREVAMVGYSIVIAVVGILGGVALIEHIKDVLRERRNAKYRLENSEDYIPPEPGFLKVAYRAWKNKFCARLEFQNPDGTHFETREEKRIRANREWREQMEAFEQQRQTGKIDGQQPNESTTGDAP